MYNHVSCIYFTYLCLWKYALIQCSVMLLRTKQFLSYLINLSYISKYGDPKANTVEHMTFVMSLVYMLTGF